jgi:hypothetical protein
MNWYPAGVEGQALGGGKGEIMEQYAGCVCVMLKIREDNGVVTDMKLLPPHTKYRAPDSDSQECPEEKRMAPRLWS